MLNKHAGDLGHISFLGRLSLGMSAQGLLPCRRIQYAGRGAEPCTPVHT